MSAAGWVKKGEVERCLSPSDSFEHTTTDSEVELDFLRSCLVGGRVEPAF